MLISGGGDDANSVIAQVLDGTAPAPRLVFDMTRTPTQTPREAAGFATV